MLTPVLILGLTVGQPFNAMVSSWLLNLLVISIWTWSTIQCFFIYRRTRAKEVAAAAALIPPPDTVVAPGDVKLALAGASVAAESRPPWFKRMHTSMSYWWASQPHGMIWCIVLLFGFFLAAQASLLPICMSLLQVSTQ